MSPRRVAILIDSLSAGGAERVAIEAAAALDRERFVPHLVVSRQTGPLEALALERDLPLTILDRTRAVSPAKLAQAHRIVRGSSLVHAHLWGSAIWGAAFARSARRPLIAHAHRFDADLSRTWLPGYRYWVAPAAYRIVCVSSTIAQAFRAGGIPSSKLEVVRNGVPAGGALDRDAARAELGLPPHAPVIGMLTRLRPEKRHELALRSVDLLRGRMPGVLLCVLGDGPEEARLHRLSADLQLEGTVRWAGARIDAARLVRAFDVLLISSSIEGMPLAALEALVEGVTVVSTPAGGVMEDILAGGGGVVVRDETPQGLAEGLASGLRAAAGVRSDASVERARELFGVERMARELEAIYDAATAAPD